MASTTQQSLRNTIEKIATPCKGILAADESTGTLGQRFASIGLENTEENRRRYRTLLCTAPNLRQSVAGIILFEETLTQKDNHGTPLTQVLMDQNILPGIKVDKGLIDLVNARQEKTTQGLDGLPERLATYKAQGACFAKWRAVYSISANQPSQLAIMTNAESLARYAAICQQLGIVPIVEPEVLMAGEHSLDQCAVASGRVLNAVFQALNRHHVQLKYIILKPSMVISGSLAQQTADPQDVAAATVRALRNHVPCAVPTINFLSGGQTPEQATDHLARMNAMGEHPWPLSFSYGRALQGPCLAAWAGKDSHINQAQQALIEQCQNNAAATQPNRVTADCCE